MISHISLDDSVKKLFDLDRIGKGPNFSILGFTDDELQIKVFKTSSEGETFEDFLDCLSEREVLFGITYFKFQDNDGIERTRKLLINWCPESAPAKKKMMSATSRSNLKKNLPGLNIEITATSLEDLYTEEILKRCIANIH